MDENTPLCVFVDAHIPPAPWWRFQGKNACSLQEIVSKVTLRSLEESHSVVIHLFELKLK